MRTIYMALAAAASLSAMALGVPVAHAQCSISGDVVARVQGQLDHVTHLSDGNGGIFQPNLMWSAVVDRVGRLCSVIKVGDAWPGSRAIAIAKASTANDFSNVKFALSTANLYAAVQPGGSLWGLNESNPFNPRFLVQGSGLGEVPGGDITFGGGVALYQSSKVIGGLGVSGDSSCADHSIAFRMRLFAHLDGTPAGASGSGSGSDNIIYGPTDASGFWQPHCFPSLDLTPQQIANPPKG